MIGRFLVSFLPAGKRKIVNLTYLFVIVKTVNKVRERNDQLPVLRGMSPATPAELLTIIAVIIARTNMLIARPQVSFSMKSVDLAAPNIWLAPWPPKVESMPPPLGFWIKTTAIRRNAFKAISMVSAVIIRVCF